MRLLVLVLIIPFVPLILIILKNIRSPRQMKIWFSEYWKFSELIGSNKKLRTFNSSINKYPTWEKYFEVNPSKVNTVDDDTDLKEKPKRSNKPVWERVLPQQPTHNSPHKVQAFKTPEEFRHYFGFRSVEFGNYLNDEIGFKHMNNCAQAYVDLANILGVSTECMSLDYELAMAFGARGKGGALGHYERSYNVINLTRDKGSLGILAHEWFHSLDRYLKRTQSESDDGGLVTELQHLEQLPADIRSATRMLVKSLKKGRSKAFIDVSKAKTTYRIKPKFIDTYERLGGDLQAFMDYYIKEYDTYTERQKEFYRMYNELDKFLDKRKRKLSREIRTWAEALSQYHLEVTGERVTMIPYTSNRTRFYNESIKLDRWKI